MLVHIYLITNRITEKYYVGQTSLSLAKRYRTHTRSAKINSKRGCRRLQHSMQKHGIENFTIEEIATANSTEEANNLETVWITALDSTNPSVGYNLSAGGGSLRGLRAWNKGLKGSQEAWNKGLHHSAETKAKIGETSKGRTPWNKGKKMSLESREKMSKAGSGKIPWNRGIPRTQETKDKIKETLRKSFLRRKQ